MSAVPEFSVRGERSERGDTVWRVLRDGEPVGGVHGSHELALVTAMSRARNARRVARRCLGCKRPFASEGAHNRLCTVCRRRGGNPFEI